MNYKIIETGVEYPDVLLYRSENKNGVNMVVIHVIGTRYDNSTMIVSEEVLFDLVESCQQFIKDYSVESAEKWCETREISF